MKHHISLQAKVGALVLDVQAELNDELIVLSGENGAGKTTLLRCLAGLQVSSGLVRMDNQTWLDSSASFTLPTEERKLGFVSSESALLPWLTVEQNIALGVKEADKVWFDFLVAELEVNHLSKRKPAMLSTGEAQRVSLVRAIFRKPCMLLLDEPFSAQAPEIRGRLRLTLQKLQQQLQIPIILVSHDMEDAKVLAEQHWRMREGKLLKEVKCEQTYKVKNNE